MNLKQKVRIKIQLMNIDIKLDLKSNCTGVKQIIK